MLNKDSLILGDSNEIRLQNIVKLLAVFGDLLSNSKIYNDSIKSKIKEYLVRVNSDNLFSANSQAIWATLNDKQRNNLVSITNAWAWFVLSYFMYHFIQIKLHQILLFSLYSFQKILNMKQQ